MDLIARKNTEAVDLMSRGESRQACAVLVEALRDLQGMLVVEHQGEEATITTPSPLTESAAAPPSHVSKISVSMPDVPSVLVSPCNTSADGLLYPSMSYTASLTSQGVDHYETSDLPCYYPRPFEIVSIPGSTLRPVGAMAGVSAVLLYNLALIRHHQGLAWGKSTILQLASRIYEQALQQLRVAASMLSATSNLSGRLVLISAICYNRSLIYMYMQDFVPAQAEISLLAEAVGHLELVTRSLELQQIEQGIGVSEEKSINPLTRDLHFFRLNLTFIRMYDFRFATAA